MLRFLLLTPNFPSLSPSPLLEVVEQDAAAGPLRKADAVPPFVVQVVLVDGQQCQVRLAR